MSFVFLWLWKLYSFLFLTGTINTYYLLSYFSPNPPPLLQSILKDHHWDKCALIFPFHCWLTNITMKQSNSWCSIVILFWETMTMDNNDPSLLCRSLPNNSSTPFQKKYSPSSTTTSPHCHSQFASVTSHHSLEPTRQQGTNTMWKISPSSGCIEYSQPWRGGRLGEVGWRGRAHQKEDPLHQHQLVSYRRYFIIFETGRSMNNWDTHE